MTNQDKIVVFNSNLTSIQLVLLQTEDLLVMDGDFLVRESTNSPGQYVLSGMHKGRIKHLLLVDPHGVVCVMYMYMYCKSKFLILLQ